MIEYRVVSRCYAPETCESIASWLTNNAADEWELVAVGPYEYVFKRETFPIHEDADF